MDLLSTGVAANQQRWELLGVTRNNTKFVREQARTCLGDYEMNLRYA